MKMPGGATLTGPTEPAPFCGHAGRVRRSRHPANRSHRPVHRASGEPITSGSTPSASGNLRPVRTG
ncbi:hypothetical protein C2U54_07310 [Leclercia sp. LSNIH1]|nr:hypothetical protein C2U54_07310 [Leclercia sp. LSNIH1]POV32144.1 hypothetical protein C3388_23145 [Leclercia sp. LSNIH5]POW61500.1 hypothetical protein C3389_22805 [Leclercia sp. LSNIH2]